MLLECVIERSKAVVTLTDQIKFVQREIVHRRLVYARNIKTGTISQHTADNEIYTIEAILETLNTLVHGQLTLKAAIRKATEDAMENWLGARPVVAN